MNYGKGSATKSKNIVSGVFTLCFVLRHVFCFWTRKKCRTLLFLCELSHQQRNNISGLAARYKIFDVNTHNEKIRFYVFAHLNTEYISLSHSMGMQLKLHYDSIVATLPEDYLLLPIFLCCVCCPMTSIPF